MAEFDTKGMIISSANTDEAKAKRAELEKLLDEGWLVGDVFNIGMTDSTDQNEKGHLVLFPLHREKVEG